MRAALPRRRRGALCIVRRGPRRAGERCVTAMRPYQHMSPPYAKSQIGHKTAALTLEIYAREMHRRDGEAERLSELVFGQSRALRSKIPSRRVGRDAPPARKLGLPRP